MLGSILKHNGSSSSQIDIQDITDGIVKLSGNMYRLVLLTGSINFELKSEEEQDALVDIFESFLNSIGFNIQILVRTREIDMDGYLSNLAKKISEETDNIYKVQLKNYRNFVSSLISTNKILNRHFYIVVPLDVDKQLDIGSIKDQLSLRADIISKNLGRLGINCRQLSSLEVIDLFYSFYSPERSKSQPLSDQVLSIMNDAFIVRGLK
ncbi:MAG: hypothetical protein ACYCPS_04725 [Candidatus Saccharimonadales bacterium]